MRAILLTSIGFLFLSSAAWAKPPVTTLSVECNWGRLTMDAIVNNNFNQGRHSSDPSGDGHGPGTADEPRAGLANVVERGNRQATCEFIEDILSE